MATLQVRSIDDNLYELLGKRAAMDNRSISQEVIAMLKEYLSEPRGKNNALVTKQFLEICGTWQDDRNADEIIGEITESRKSKKRFKKEIF